MDRLNWFENKSDSTFIELECSRNQLQKIFTSLLDMQANFENKVKKKKVQLLNVPSIQRKREKIRNLLPKKMPNLHFEVIVKEQNHNGNINEFKTPDSSDYRYERYPEREQGRFSFNFQNISTFNYVSPLDDSPLKLSPLREGLFSPPESCIFNEAIIGIEDEPTLDLIEADIQ